MPPAAPRAIATPEASRALGPLLADANERVRREAVLGFGRRHDPEVVERVRAFLSDPARRVRVAAAVVLGRQRDRECVPQLLERLQEPGTWEKPAVLVALGRIGSLDAVPALLSAADHPAHWVRVCALHALSDLGVPEARTAALAHTQDVAWAVRGAAAIALGAAGGIDDLPVLLALLRDDHSWPRRGATYALGRLADDGARDDLLRLLYGVRPGDADELALRDSDDGSDAPLRSDAESRLFDSAVQALGRLSRGTPDPLVHRALIEVRERLSEEELDRLARLPLPELGVDRSPPTLRALFEIALPSSADEEDLV